MDALIPVAILSGVLLYPPLQYFALRRLRGAWRTMAFIPAVPMVPVLILTAVGWFTQSNLWPILLIFAAPPALFYLIALMVVHRLVARPVDAGTYGA